MPEAAVELEDLHKRYGAQTALAGLTCQIERGRLTALLGPNGAGKTTSIEICEGFRRPDRGTVRVLGRDPHRDGAALRPRVGDRVLIVDGGRLVTEGTPEELTAGAPGPGLRLVAAPGLPLDELLGAL